MIQFDPHAMPGTLVTYPSVGERKGVWIVADPHWDTGPGADPTPHGSEVEALRAVNQAGYQQRAWFVPFGISLREVMLGEQC